KPADEVVQINDGQTTITSGTYTQQTGSLQVTISPPEAVAAGAQWRVDNNPWRNSGYTESGLPVGSHTVEYSVVSGWAKPGNEAVQINYNQTTITSGTYTQQTGSLQVTISPPEAVAAGAQWRVDNNPWRDSGYTESGLSVGSHTVEYSTVSGWNKPADEVVQINDGQTTNTSGTYILQTGSLQVTISPPEAVAAGAQWRVDGGTWRNSGYTETGLLVGSHTVEYNTVSGWNKPADEVVQINDGQTTNTSGTYILQTGSLRVTISPQGATDAGAQWRVDGGTWRNSGYTETGLLVGSHTVEYNTVSGWNKPADEVVQINDGQTTTTSGTYIEQTGSLQVTISPPGAVTAGAQWRVDGGTWRNSGYTESGLSIGSHTVEYSVVSGWDKPADEVVQINDGQTTTTSGTYIEQTGSLQVTISPPEAVTAGAQWRVAGGTWRDSGYTESGLSVGLYAVDFNDIDGWTKPANQIVQINDGQTTTISGTYIEQTDALLVISEFMASNDSTLATTVDGQEVYPDWIEVYNPTDAAVSLDGWYLTDNDANLIKWQFPDGLVIRAGEFLIVFASNKEYADDPSNYPYIDDANYYHTNFNLRKNDPYDYLALVVADGNTISHEYAPTYPQQLTDVSYGLAQYASMLVPTGATASYYVPTSGDAGVNWFAIDFNDSTWDTGATGLGFGAAVTETGQDIGTPSAAGSYSVANGVYTVVGDGEDIWGATDDFYYVYTPLTGDGEITARVVSIGHTNDWAKAGVMIRETLSDTSSHAMMIVTPPEGTTDAFSFQWVNGTNRDNHTTGGDVTLPAWVKIVRIGDTFTGYHAPDESGVPGAWVQQASETITMVEDVYIGLCVTSHSDGVLCTAVFDNVDRGGDISSDLKDKMLGINASLWARIEFNLEAGESDLFDTLTLRMKYEDGFAAFLNGQKVAESNAPGSLQWNSTALGDRPIENASVFETFNLMAYLDTLQTGKNVLAIHGLNDNMADGEFLILPELVAASNQQVPQYFATATPGTFNISGAEGITSEVWFSHERGFYDTAFDMALYTEMDDAEIRYTFDGSRPTVTNGITYTDPCTINETTTVRAAAVRPGWLDSEVETHTYIFLDDVVTQSPNGEAPSPDWPAPGVTINSQHMDYGMDPDIVNDGTWAPQMEQALTSIPTMSIVTDLDNLFDPGNGIYVNAGGHGRGWERRTSLELIYPPNPQGPGFPDLAEVPDGNGGVLWELPAEMRGGFQIDAGLRIRGGYSRSGNNPKHAFRLFFRNEYGSGKLNYPLFGDEGVDSFDKVDLRTSQNYSWSYHYDSTNAMCRDVWARDTQGLMGRANTRSRYYHLYINGQYWGVFQTQERPEAAYGASYFGGNREDWDCVKATGPNANYTIEATDGTLDAWQELWDLANLGFASDENYYHAQGLDPSGTRDPCYPVLLDVDNLIDYMIMVFFDGDRDAPISNFLSNNNPNNWYGIRNSTGEEGFRYFVHDAEHIMSKGLTDRTGPYPCGDLFQHSNPQWIHQELMAHPDYRLRFADRAHKHLFNSALLTSIPAIGRFEARADQIDMAIIAESARWGDSKRVLTDPPRTKTDWQNAINNEVNNFFPTRDGVIVSQLRNTTLRSGVLAPIYPSVDASSVDPPGGWDPIGFTVTMDAPSGTIWYTTDGNDPRLPVPLSSPGSEVTLVAENATKRYLVPTGPVAAGTGTILRELWTGITGGAVSDLTSSPDFPGNPSDFDYLTSFEAPIIDWADYYGTRVRGYIHPPTNGNYTFWISTDDGGELWLSTNEDSANKALIAHVPGWSNSREWTRYAEQQSVSIPLTAGQKYYIEALQKEHEGGDNLAVTWEGPGIIPDSCYPNPIGGQYLSPVGDIWATNFFDDSNWPSDTGGVGYERSPGDPVNFVGLFNIDVEGQMYGNNSTCYLRIPFTVSHTYFSDMTLKIRYDDGFVTYINGVEVARRNFTGAPVWDSNAFDMNPDSNAINFEYIDISSHISALQPGDNVLAIHGLNVSTTSTDFLISAELVATEISQGDVSPSAIPYTVPVTLNKSTNVKARVLDGTWSALNEAIFAIGPVADNLRITEMMYHPQDTGDPNNDPNAEFIELKNIGPETINLSLARFT
ncbi:MAG: FN3 associated domain-containing protein, partial [Planctomycetota bacterium]